MKQGIQSVKGWSSYIQKFDLKETGSNRFFSSHGVNIEKKVSQTHSFQVQLGEAGTRKVRETFPNFIEARNDRMAIAPAGP